MVPGSDDEKGELLLSFEEKSYGERIKKEMRSDRGLTSLFFRILIPELMIATPLCLLSKDPEATVLMLLAMSILQFLGFLAYIKGVGTPKKQSIQLYANGIGFKQEPKSWLYSGDSFIPFRKIKALVSGKDGELVVRCVLAEMGADDRILALEHQQEIIEAYENFRNRGTETA